MQNAWHSTSTGKRAAITVTTLQGRVRAADSNLRPKGVVFHGINAKKCLEGILFSLKPAPESVRIMTSLLYRSYHKFPVKAAKFILLRELNICADYILKNQIMDFINPL